MTISNNIKKWVAIIVAAILAGLGITFAVTNQDGKIVFQAEIEYSEEQQPAFLEDGDQGEYVEENVPTVESVDGGQFEDETTGVSVTEGEYADLGWSETYDTSSPEAFKNATIGRCIIANNRYGAQCVSLARVFWWSYANRDVSTCGTGMAKGMMNCAEQNAGSEFEIHWRDDVANIQAGDWLIFGDGQFGHVGMALGSVHNGYVALLGENQGGASCGAGVGGSATNIINISTRSIIGFYRPKKYVKPAPAPAPTPAPAPANNGSYTVKKGDTLGGIIRKMGWYTSKKGLFGDTGYAQKVAEKNGIPNRGLIYPGKVIYNL